MARLKRWAWAILGATTLAACTVESTDQGAAALSRGAGAAKHGAGAGNVTVLVTPDASVPAQIVAAIEGATASVHMTMYLLDDARIVEALVDRKRAGLDVRVVLNQTFPRGGFETDWTTYSTLRAAGVGVVWRHGPPGAAPGAYTHAKTFILDGKQAWIMTMNLVHSAPRYNREYLVVDDEAAHVQEADRIFLADYAGIPSTSSGPLVVSPDPPNNSRTALVALIDSATKTLDVEVEELSDNGSGGVVAAIAAAARRGVATRVVLPATTPTEAQQTAIATVRSAGAAVVVSGRRPGEGTPESPFIHAKAITVDCEGTVCVRGFTGSQNFTRTSLGHNRELGVLIDDARELAKIEAAIDADFSKGTPQ